MRKAAVVVVLLTVAGCGFFSRTKSRFFTIEPVPAGAGAAAGGRVPVSVDIVELPPGFDRKEIVVRKADQQLEVRETDQWTSLLEPAVIHAVAFNLASRLPEGMVILPGQAVPAGPKRSVDLMFEDLAAGPANEVVIDVRWTLRGGDAAETTQHERIVTPIGSLDSAEVASGMSQGLATLADRIVARLGGE